jgi:hypothetical protein
VRLERIGLEAEQLSQWLCGALSTGGTTGDAAREGRAVGNASEDGSKRRTRLGAADAAAPVPPGALQVDCRTGGAPAAHRAQAGAVKALRHREEPKRYAAQLRTYGRANEIAEFCGTHQRGRPDKLESGRTR